MREFNEQSLLTFRDLEKSERKKVRFTYCMCTNDDQNVRGPATQI